MNNFKPTWEEFDHVGASRADNKPYVSIQRRGSFTINGSAYEAMGKPEALRLLYDREHKIVGFRPAKVGDRAAYKIIKHDQANSYTAAAKAFANFYDIDISQTRRYALQQYGEVYGIDLNAPEGLTGRTVGKQ